MDNTNSNLKENQLIEFIDSLKNTLKIATSTSFLFIVIAFFILILNNYIPFNLNFTYVVLAVIYIFYVITTLISILNLTNITLKNTENKNKTK